jgi:hypothetical protein
MGWASIDISIRPITARSGRSNGVGYSEEAGNAFG